MCEQIWIKRVRAGNSGGGTASEL